jgi:hypothetical protein
VTAILPALRRRQRWLARLLPLLLLRSLIPVGFMPVAAGAGFIGLCPDAAAMPPGMVMHEHMHHAGGADQNGHAPPCPFALSAAIAGVPTLSELIAHFSAVAPAELPAFASLRIATILRAQAPRGPPLSLS